MVPAMGAAEIERLLVAARETVERLPVCWLATRAETGGAHCRAVRIRASPVGRDAWTRRFLCRRGSRKAAEMALDPLVTLAFQDDGRQIFLGLGGPVSLIDDRVEMRDMWPEAMDAIYPPGFADANMIVARVEIDRIEIHARGITPEPFGHGRTLLMRDGKDAWRFVPD